MDEEKEELLKQVMSKRGFVLDFHRVMIEEDPEFMKRYDALVELVSTQQRTLSKKVKEFIFIGVLTALQAQKNHIGKHIRRALEQGASKKEILEVFELIYPPCGTLRFMNGLKAFKEVFDEE